MSLVLLPSAFGRRFRLGHLFRHLRFHCIKIEARAGVERGRLVAARREQAPLRMINSTLYRLAAGSPAETGSADWTAASARAAARRFCLRMVCMAASFVWLLHLHNCGHIPSAVDCSRTRRVEPRMEGERLGWRRQPVRLL